jgi:Tol biopolymer transport system component
MLLIGLAFCLLFAPLTWAMPPLGQALLSSGSITYSSETAGNADLYTLDVDRGLRYNMTRHISDDIGGVWSADGRQLAYFQRVGPSAALSIWRLGLPEITGFRWQDRGFPRGMTWSPDGKYLAFADDRSGLDMYVFQIDAPSEPDVNPLRLTSEPGLDAQPIWISGGQRLIFTSWMDGDADIYTMDIDGGGLVNLTQHPSDDASPSLSPDGTQIAFFSLRTRMRELYLMESDGQGLRQLTAYEAMGNGNYWFTPLWSPDGTRLAITAVYEDDPEIVIVNVATGETTRLTVIPNMDTPVLWLPDNEHLVFRSFLNVEPQLYLLDMQGRYRQLTTEGFPSFDAALWPQ